MIQTDKIVSIIMVGILILTPCTATNAGDFQNIETTKYTEIINDGVNDACLDIIRVFCAHDEEKLYFKLEVAKSFMSLDDFGVVHILIDSDLDTSTGLEKREGKNYGGEDHFINVSITNEEVSGELVKLKQEDVDEKVCDLEPTYVFDILEISVNRIDLNNTDGIRFFVSAICPELPDTEDQTEFGLTYSLTSEEIIEPCEMNPPHLLAHKTGEVVKLSWKLVAADITGYNIYKSSDGADFEKINSDPLLPFQDQFIDFNVAEGTQHKYYMTVICKSGSESSRSNIAAAESIETTERAILRFMPSLIGFGSKQNPLGETKTIRIKNDGNKIFEGSASCEASWLEFSEKSITVKPGKVEDLIIKINENLTFGNYETNIIFRNSEGMFFGKVPIILFVPKSDSTSRFVQNLTATPEINKIILTWNPPASNHEKVLIYKIEKGEKYGGEFFNDFEDIKIAASETIFVDQNIFSESEFTYTVTPIYRSGDGEAKVVTARPLPKQIWISMVIGSDTALVDEEAVKLDTPPTVVSDRTVVPFRFLGEALGAVVGYESKTKTAVFTKGRKIIKIPIGKKTAEIDGKEVEINPEATIKNGRTLVPLRFVSEAFSSEVKWNNKEKGIDIFYPGDYRPSKWTED